MAENIPNFEEQIKKLEEQLEESQKNGSRWIDYWTKETVEKKNLQAKVEILKEIIREMIAEGKK